MTKTHIPRIERQMAKMAVPHEEKKITFAYPSVGPDTYIAVGKKILSQRRRVPTGDYMASLLHAVYCDNSMTNEPEFKNIQEIMKNEWLWVFNRNLWTKDGVYVVQDTKTIGTSKPLGQKNLEKMLKGSKEFSNGVRFSKDGKVRFAPKDSYQLGRQKPESLAKNGFMIANYGIEGAEKLGEVSSKFKDEPYVNGLEINAEERKVIGLFEGRVVYDPKTNITQKQGVSAIFAGRSMWGSWLVVGGFDDDRHGDAFGVLKD